MAEDEQGTVVTFYSYKGGTGRTMALANAAWILAASGYRVLTVDWDLDSPGLPRFFHPFLDEDAIDGTHGVWDLLQKFQLMAGQRHRPVGWVSQIASVNNYAMSLNWPHFPNGGRLDFIGAGRRLLDYVEEVEWYKFYEQRSDENVFEALRADMKQRYDFTLIDSRTGESDIAQICTVQMPDVVVNCFTLSEQGIAGGAKMAETIRSYQSAKRPRIRVLPLQTRIDITAEKERSELGFARAREMFAGYPEGFTDEERDTYWAEMVVPYQAYYNYEEILATFGDEPQNPNRLLPAYEKLVQYLTDGKVTRLPPPEPGAPIAETKQRFLRHRRDPRQSVVLQYEPDDQAWVEWVRYVLEHGGLTVHAAEVGQTAPAEETRRVRSLTIVSRDRARRADEPASAAAGSNGQLILEVGMELSRVARPGQPNSVSIAGLGQDPDEAARRVLALAGGTNRVNIAGAPRFPGNPTRVFNVPQENPNFTGREHDLQEIRAALGRHSRVALLGPSGVGKTQVAMAYANRFRASYDLVWWIESGAEPDALGRTDQIGPSLLNLGQAADVPLPPSGTNPYRWVLRALGRDERYARQLLIFDSADHPDLVSGYLPESGGHVLVTSNHRAWKELAQHTVDLGSFSRSESIEQLRRRHPLVSDADADAVAAAIGDFPMRLAIAGAHLEEYRTPVPQYLTELDLGPGVEAERRVWALALQALAESSPAASGLLQLLSVFAPGGIAADLAYSKRFGDELARVDPTAIDEHVRKTLANHLSRLALIKVDTRDQRGPGLAATSATGSQIVIHRLLRDAVQATMTQEEIERRKELVHTALVEARPPGLVDDPTAWVAFSQLWPHLDASDAMSCDDAAVRELLVDWVRFLWRIGDFDRGIDVAHRVDSTWSEMLESARDPAERLVLRRQLLRLRFNRGNIVREQGGFEESLRLDNETYAAQMALPPPNHPDTLRTRGGIGADLRALGRYREALSWDEETFGLWQSVEPSPESESWLLRAWNNLAVSHRQMGHFAEALRIDEEVWRRRRARNPDDPLALHSQGNVGRDLRELGRYDESIELLQSVRDRFREMLGPDDRHTLVAEANLAVSLRTVGKTEAAEDLARYAYTRLRDLLGEANPDTQQCRLSRSLTLLAAGQSESARSEMITVQEVYRRGRLEAGHPHALVCTNNLAMIDRALKDRASALRLSREAADGLTERLGDEHPYALAARSNQAICLAETGDATRALEILRDVRTRSTKVLGRDHPDTIRCVANIALARRAAGETDDDADVRSIEQRLSDTIGPAHPAVVALGRRDYLHRVLDPHPY